MPVPNDLTYIPHLQYSAARPEIQSGDILLCSGNSFFSDRIKAATESQWSHVGVVVWWHDIERIMVLESVESIGVRTVPLSNYFTNYNGTGKPYKGYALIARHKYYMPGMTKHLSQNAVGLLGHQYDNKEIARIAIKLTLAAKLMKEIRGSDCEIPSDDSCYICSEYAYTLYKAAGLSIAHSCGFVTPADFANTPEVEPVCVLA
jgi:hypothetical protein